MNLVINKITKDWHISTMLTLGENEVLIKNYDVSNIDLANSQNYKVNSTLSGIEININQLKPVKLSEIQTAYNNANKLDISYLNTTFQADTKSQALLVSVLSAGSVPSGFFWIDKANTQVAMTFAELQGLSGAILTRNQANFKQN